MKLGQACASPRHSREVGCAAIFSSRTGKGVSGQAGSEYLILLGAVLVIGLVVVGLMLYYPGTSDDIKKTQSQLQWQTAKPLAVKEAYGFADTHILRLKNQQDNRIYLNGIKIDDRNVFYLYYGGWLDIGDPFQRIGPESCFAVYELNCSIPIDPGEEIYIQYNAYDGWAGNWTGEPKDACGMRNASGNEEVYFNSLREHAEAKLKIYYTSYGVASAQGSDVALLLDCFDYDFRCTTSNDCKNKYHECVLGSCSTNTPGMCMAAC